jgi:hypothetical protein
MLRIQTQEINEEEKGYVTYLFSSLIYAVTSKDNKTMTFLLDETSKKKFLIKT